MMIPLIVLCVALVMMAIGTVASGQSWPQFARWHLRATAFNSVQAAMVWVAGVACTGWIMRRRPWSADGLGVVGGAIAGYLAITFVYYWWHRWRHESPFLWRWFHQFNHSRHILVIIISFYIQLFELFAYSVLSSAILYLMVGLGPQAAAQTLLIKGLVDLFCHWNVRTPYWLGFIVQRPESHCLHQLEEGHIFNYSDLPVWDMLFGTFRNPRRWEARCGFGVQ